MTELPTSIKRARALRQKMTGAEQLLWANLRNRKLLGLKFLRQHPIIYQVSQNRPYYFIADFYCAEKKLVIEVDGSIHELQKEEDEHREDILKSLNLNIWRIKNEEVEDIHEVLKKIRMYVMNL